MFSDVFGQEKQTKSGKKKTHGRGEVEGEVENSTHSSIFTHNQCSTHTSIPHTIFDWKFPSYVISLG